MRLTLEDIKEKEIVNLTDGTCFGCAGDVVIDTETKLVMALLIKGKLKFFGLFGREDDITIPWEKIDTIGRDTILVKTSVEYASPNKQKKSLFTEFISNFFNNF